MRDGLIIQHTPTSSDERALCLMRATEALADTTTDLRDRQRDVMNAHAALREAVAALRLAQARHRWSIRRFEHARVDLKGAVTS